MKVASPEIPAIDLEAIPEALRRPVATLLELVRLLTSENIQLRSRIDLLVRRIYGNRKNERTSESELQGLLAGIIDEVLAAQNQPPAPEPPKSSTRRAPATPRQRALPEDLPVRNTTLLIPEEVKAHPEAFREIDRTTTRVLDYEPGRFVQDLFIRPRYVAKVPVAETDSAAAHSTPATAPVLAAPLPNRLIEKGLPGVGLLTHLILTRFEDHMPFYRIEKALAQRSNVRIRRQTMMGWMDTVGEWFRPLYDLMRKELLSSGYIQVDETVIRYLDRDRPGKSHNGYFWAYGRPGGNALFEWNTRRSSQVPAKFLEGYRGKLQCDGYAVYPKLATSLNGCELFFCLTHFRRKFDEAKDEDRRAAWYLLMFRHLAAIERKLRQVRAGPDLREAVRRSEAAPILARMRKAMEVHQGRVLPSSRMGQAIRYGLARWEGLERYATCGKAEIDTNFIENAIRPTAVGKKNFLFIGHPESGWRSAMLYSILASCRSHGINPEMYLRDVLTRLPDLQQSELGEYTPAAWKKKHPEAWLNAR